MSGKAIVALAHLLFVLIVAGNATISFPFIFQAPTYNATWDSNIPTVNITTYFYGQVKALMTFDFESWEERQYYHLWDYQNKDDFDKKATNTANYNTIHTEAFNETNWAAISRTETNNTNEILEFSTVFSNNATCTITYTFVRDKPFTIEIPGWREDQTCFNFRNGSSEPARRNCTCQETVDITVGSTKIAFRLENWPFASLEGNYSFSVVTLKFKAVAPLFDVTNLAALRGIGTYPTCMSFFLNLAFENGSIQFPFQSFTHLIADNHTNSQTGIVLSYLPSSLFDKTFPMMYVFGNFSSYLEYDPDFNVLFPRGNGNGGEDQDRDYTSEEIEDNHDVLIISVSVIVPTVVIGSVIIVVALTC